MAKVGRQIQFIRVEPQDSPSIVPGFPGILWQVFCRCANEQQAGSLPVCNGLSIQPPAKIDEYCLRANLFTKLTLDKAAKMLYFTYQLIN